MMEKRVSGYRRVGDVGWLDEWITGKTETVGAKHSSQGVKVIPAAVNKNASPLMEHEQKTMIKKKIHNLNLESFLLAQARSL